jgi:hypothetical protein
MNHTSGPNPSRAAARTVETLGAPLGTQRPSLANRFAAAILGLLLIAGGLALAGFIVKLTFTGPPSATRQDLWAGILLGLLGVVFSLLLIAGGIALLYFAWRLFSLRVAICSEGFYCTARGETDVFAWDEIVAVEETVVHESLPLVKGPAKHLMPKVTSRSYVVKRCDGKEFNLDDNILSRPLALVAPLRAATLKRKTPWKVVDS